MGRSTFSGPVAGAYAVVPLVVAGTLSAGDGAVKWPAPFACRLVHVGAHLGDTGGTSGATSVQLSVDATDYLTASLDIAYDDTDGVAETTDLAAQAIARGDVLEVDIDSVPESASSDLTVYLTVYVKEHTLTT